MAFNFKRLPPVEPITPGITLVNKTILITGSNQGMGLEVARQLLILKASTVILAVRNVSKGKAAKELLLSDPQIKALSIRPKITVMQVDMMQYKSVMNFVEKVKTEVPQLDALLLNAGIGQLNYELASTGHEKVMQVNYLSNTLLALELLPLLESTAEKTGVPSRLSVVGSRQHEISSFAKQRPFVPGQSVLERMDDKLRYSGMTVYGDTKLLVAMFVAELAERVGSGKLIINHMCPSMVNTNMSDVLPFGLRQIVNWYKGVYGRSIEVGGWILVHALFVAGQESHGRFLRDKNLNDTTPFMLSVEGKEMQSQLWNETSAEIRKVDPKIAGVVAA